MGGLGRYGVMPHRIKLSLDACKRVLGLRGVAPEKSEDPQGKRSYQRNRCELR